MDSLKGPEAGADQSLHKVLPEHQGRVGDKGEAALSASLARKFEVVIWQVMLRPGLAGECLDAR